MTPQARALRRYLSTGTSEVALAAILPTIDLLALHPNDDAAVAVLVEFISCFGAAFTAWHPRIGASLTCTALIGLALLPAQLVGATLLTPLIVVLSCAWHEELWTAAVATVWGYLVSLWMSFRNTTTPLQDTQANVLWLGLYALPWTVGLALRHSRAAERERFESRAQAGRREIAAELHDSITHNLALITMRAETAAFNDKIDSNATLAEIAQRTREISASVRNMVELLNLGHSPLSLDFASQLQSGQDTLADEGFQLKIVSHCDFDQIEPEISNVLGHITREAVNNILRHGDPTELCEVTITSSERSVDVRFTNATNSASQEEDFGIKDMRGRVQEVHGTLTTQLSHGYWSTMAGIKRFLMMRP